MMLSMAAAHLGSSHPGALSESKHDDDADIETGR